MNGDDRRLIGGLEAQVKALCERADRTELNRSIRHKEVFDRLGVLEAAGHYKKGKRAGVGLLFTLASVPISAAVAAVVTTLMGGG